MRDSPTGTEGDWERRGQQAACHGDPTYGQTLVASGDSEGDRTCQRLRDPSASFAAGIPAALVLGREGKKEGALLSLRPWACYRGGGE